MSTNSYSYDCPKCKCTDTLMISEDNKPYLSICGECVECGFTYWTIKDQMCLEELNELREMYELEPLTALPNIKVEEWRTNQ